MFVRPFFEPSTKQLPTYIIKAGNHGKNNKKICLMGGGGGRQVLSLLRHTYSPGHFPHALAVMKKIIGIRANTNTGRRATARSKRQPLNLFTWPNHVIDTVEARSADTRLIRTPGYYGQFCLSRRGKAHTTFSLQLTRLIRTLWSVPLVSILTRFYCICFYCPHRLITTASLETLAH